MEGKIIKKIRWNGRVQAVSFNGDITGEKFAYDEAEVSEFTRASERVKEIKEDSLTVYSIYYSNGDVKRIFNPIEVLYT